MIPLPMSCQARLFLEGEWVFPHASFLVTLGIPKRKTTTRLLLCLWMCGNRVQMPSYYSGWTTERHRQSSLFEAGIGWQSLKPVRRYEFWEGELLLVARGSTILLVCKPSLWNLLKSCYQKNLHLVTVGFSLC